MRRPALIVLLASVVGAAATARLGLWQLDRAAAKLAQYERLQARDGLPPLDVGTLARAAAQVDEQVQRRVRLRGRWLGERSVWLDNRPLDGRPGFVLLTPLQLGSDDMVLVQRGWVQRHAADRTRLAPVTTPDGLVEVEGRIAPGPSRLYEFEASASGPIRQNLEVAAYARETGLPLRPLLVVQIDGPADDGLSRHWAEGPPDVSTHYGYAVQWFGLSALITGLYVWFQIIRPRRTRAR